jgi:FixJ family two-component response regulator
MSVVTASMLNKQIAAELGTSEITVKVHQSNAKIRDQSLSLLAPQ